MNIAERYAPLLGRLLIAQLFLVSGFNKITGFSGTADFMAGAGMPMAAVLLVGAIVLEILGGASVLLGYRAKLGALALIVFTVPATLIFHNYWALEGAEAYTQMLMFTKNVAIVGGLLVIAGLGSGPLSLDSAGKANSPQAA